jgi:hypothetical protein
MQEKTKLWQAVLAGSLSALAVLWRGASGSF